MCSRFKSKRTVGIRQACRVASKALFAIILNMSNVIAPSFVQTVDERVGELVRVWMYRREVRQPELAKQLGITQQTASRKISGKITWSVTDLAKTAALLDVPLSELMPEDTVEIAKSLEANASRDRGTVAGAGFEPTTSGL